MNVRADHQAVYYPFHLCHEETLRRLLVKYRTIHFMDHMAIQLTEMSGITAAPDRMGDSFPKLLASGHIAQGYPFCGPLDGAILASTNRDLADPSWRAIFHDSL